MNSPTAQNEDHAGPTGSVRHRSLGGEPSQPRYEASGTRPSGFAPRTPGQSAAVTAPTSATVPVGTTVARSARCSAAASATDFFQRYEVCITYSPPTPSTRSASHGDTATRAINPASGHRLTAGTATSASPV